MLFIVIIRTAAVAIYDNTFYLKEATFNLFTIYVTTFTCGKGLSG